MTISNKKKKLKKIKQKLVGVDGKEKFNCEVREVSMRSPYLIY